MNNANVIQQQQLLWQFRDMPKATCALLNGGGMSCDYA